MMRVSFIPTNLRDILVESLQNLAQAAFNQTEEVKVWQKTDRYGNAYWHVYDPKTGHSVHLGSEEEVMSWIESHYYF
jgi:cation transport regulator ChaB